MWLKLALVKMAFILFVLGKAKLQHFGYLKFVAILLGSLLG